MYDLGLKMTNVTFLQFGNMEIILGNFCTEIQKTPQLSIQKCFPALVTGYTTNLALVLIMLSWNVPAATL